MLVAAELTASAASLRRASVSVRSRIDDTAHTRSAISHAGLAGESAYAGLDLLANLGRALGIPATTMDELAAILDEASAAQKVLDYAKEALTSMLVPPGLRVAHQAMLATLSLMEHQLDQACAAAVANACRLEHEQDMDRLVFHPDEPLAQISADRLASAPASVRGIVDTSGGVVLEGGPDGYTVMIGAELDAAGEPIPPQSVTTMVSGVGSGHPEKFAGAIKEAQSVAAATGGAVIVWQGYSPPPNVPAGMARHSAAAGADDLAAFQMALDERFPDARKVVVGHSYGSVVAARAAQEYGLFADHLFLAGSPGVGAAHASDLILHSENPKITVADSPGDPIRLLRAPLAALHGHDPATGRFGAESVPGIRGGHTDYFSDDAMLRALAQAARER